MIGGPGLFGRVAIDNTLGFQLECLIVHPLDSRLLTGVPGFEPGNAGVKVPCLTTWLHPMKIRQCSLYAGSCDLRFPGGNTIMRSSLLIRFRATVGVPRVFYIEGRVIDQYIYIIGGVSFPFSPHPVGVFRGAR